MGLYKLYALYILYVSLVLTSEDENLLTLLFAFITTRQGHIKIEESH